MMTTPCSLCTVMLSPPSSSRTSPDTTDGPADSDDATESPAGSPPDDDDDDDATDDMESDSSEDWRCVSPMSDAPELTPPPPPPPPPPRRSYLRASLGAPRPLAWTRATGALRKASVSRPSKTHEHTASCPSEQLPIIGVEPIPPSDPRASHRPLPPAGAMQPDPCTSRYKVPLAPSEPRPASGPRASHFKAPSPALRPTPPADPKALHGDPRPPSTSPPPSGPRVSQVQAPPPGLQPNPPTDASASPVDSSATVAVTLSALLDDLLSPCTPAVLPTTNTQPALPQSKPKLRPRAVPGLSVADLSSPSSTHFPVVTGSVSHKGLPELQQVRRGLFIGTQRAANEKQLLEAMGITHILSMNGSAPLWPQGFQYHTVCTNRILESRRSVPPHFCLLPWATGGPRRQFVATVTTNIPCNYSQLPRDSNEAVTLVASHSANVQLATNRICHERWVPGIRMLLTRCNCLASAGTSSYYTSPSPIKV